MKIHKSCDEFEKKNSYFLNLPMNMAEKKVQDSSEVIENEELSGFLKDLLELVKKVTALMLIDF